MPQAHACSLMACNTWHLHGRHHAWSHVPGGIDEQHLLPYASLASTQKVAAAPGCAQRRPSPLSVQCLGEGAPGSTFRG
jgi:hypothetical protein